MHTFTMMLAGVSIEVRVNYDHAVKYCEDYVTDAPAEVFIEVSEEDIDNERARQTKASGKSSRGYVEHLVLYRKICTELAFRNIVLIHGSAIMAGGKTFLFCAPSGTGKSTHTRLWREYLKDEVVMINDDKPLVRITEDGTPVVYGTPWNGKHRLGCNMSAPLNNICFLARGEKNEIESISKDDALYRLAEFVFRPDDPLAMAAEIDTAGSIVRFADFWSLKCNMDPQAAEIAFKGMAGSK